MVVPTLTVNRLIILRDNRFVYDQTFHKGVNIIRGDNGTGKSTIMDLLYYALGAEVTKWNQEQERCTHTLIEVLLNNRPFCLRREITNTGQAPMYFFEGGSEEALKDMRNWLQYPSRRSNSKHSYSQQLFELLGLPQHKTDDSTNLTMHQILRLMYVDQMTEPSKLLKDDPKWDNPVIRKAIGEFLLGIDDLEAHMLRQRLIDANKEFESINGELKAIYRVLQEDSQVFRRESLLKEINDAENRIAELEAQQKAVRTEKLENLNARIKERALEINGRLQQLASKKSDLLERKSIVNSELIDTKHFLGSIRFRLESIEQSKLTNSELGEVSFKFCPACLVPIDEHGDDSSCSLCKTETDGTTRHVAYMQMINELNFQVRESEALIEMFQQEVDKISSSLPSLDKEAILLKNEYQTLVENADAVDATLSEIATEIGFYRSQIVNMKEKIELVEKIEGLQADKEEASLKINRIKEELRQIEFANENRKFKIYGDIEALAIDMLKRDGGYEDAFIDPEEVSFDFNKDRMFVNGRSKFSASSMVIMKNAIRAAIFIQSVKDPLMRLPRFFMNDNIEDKGMVPERSQNFQKLLVESCLELEAEFQLIFSTSMIAPELDTPELTVGPYYRKGEHTLAFH